MDPPDALRALILDALCSGDIEDTLALRLGGEGPLDQQRVQGCLSSLASREMVAYRRIERESYVLTEEARDIALHGSHEAKIFRLVSSSADGLTLRELESALGPSLGHGLRQVFRNGWARRAGDRLVKNVESITDAVSHSLRVVQQSGTHPDAGVLAELRRRRLLEKKKQLSFSVKKGPNFALSVREQIADLTVAVLQSRLHESVEFKPYNFEARGASIPCGSLHPLLKMRAEFRLIFFELGFEEMPANKFVESCFWNFDSLFVPQQHPARDLQDTFYIRTPQLSRPVQERGYVDAVRRVHEEGDFGSTGYRYPWSLEESRRLVLRTHTTSVSAAMLYRLANQEGGFAPAKYFSIDRVFRNETVDSTHLAEFHQVEGVIADYNLTLGDLIGFMDLFYSKMGVKNLKYRPTYNPYTEPSLEIYSYHEGLKRWVEIGNSGLFRPEMLEPMGLPKDVRVFGWGLSLERPTMIKYGLNNIRDLLGHKVDLDKIQASPAVRLNEGFV